MKEATAESELNWLNSITEQAIGAAYRVGNALGPGFLEKVYENALAHELRKTGLAVEQQRSIKVIYDGVVVGEYLADLLIESSVVIELKVIKAFDEIHVARALNYLKATGLKICLLINFGKLRVDVKRIVKEL